MLETQRFTASGPHVAVAKKYAHKNGLLLVLRSVFREGVLGNCIEVRCNDGFCDYLREAVLVVLTKSFLVLLFQRLIWPRRQEKERFDALWKICLGEGPVQTGFRYGYAACFCLCFVLAVPSLDSSSSCKVKFSKVAKL